MEFSHYFLFYLGLQPWLGYLLSILLFVTWVGFQVLLMQWFFIFSFSITEQMWSNHSALITQAFFFLVQCLRADVSTKPSIFCSFIPSHQFTTGSHADMVSNNHTKSHGHLEWPVSLAPDACLWELEYPGRTCKHRTVSLRQQCTTIKLGLASKAHFINLDHPSTYEQHFTAACKVVLNGTTVATIAEC